jgi:hypothetical protein
VYRRNSVVTFLPYRARAARITYGQDGSSLRYSTNAALWRSLIFVALTKREVSTPKGPAPCGRSLVTAA